MIEIKVAKTTDGEGEISCSMKGEYKEILAESLQIFKTLLDQMKGQPIGIIFKYAVLGYLEGSDSQD